MLSSKGSALVHTRTKFAGFREGFAVQPKDISQADAQRLKKLVFDATADIADIRPEHRIRRMIFADKDYVILGIGCFLNDLAAGDWTDIGSRPSYGFFGYVWKRAEFKDVAAFPEKEAFLPLFNDFIRNNWEQSKNSKWAHETALAEYAYAVETVKSARVQGNVLALDKRLYLDKEEDLLLDAVLRKVNEGRNVSACTACGLYTNVANMPFHHMTILNVNDATRLEEIMRPKRKTNEKPKKPDDSERLRNYDISKRENASTLKAETSVENDNMKQIAIGVGTIVAAVGGAVLIGKDIKNFFFQKEISNGRAGLWCLLGIILIIAAIALFLLVSARSKSKNQRNEFIRMPEMQGKPDVSREPEIQRKTEMQSNGTEKKVRSKKDEMYDL